MHDIVDVSMFARMCLMLFSGFCLYLFCMETCITGW
jgi:hypothetical protein